MDLIQAFSRYSPIASKSAIIASIFVRDKATRSSFLTSCPRCGYLAEAWTEDGVNVRVRCKMCGYEGIVPHPDLPERPWRVG